MRTPSEFEKEYREFMQGDPSNGEMATYARLVIPELVLAWKIEAELVDDLCDQILKIDLAIKESA